MDVNDEVQSILFKMKILKSYFEDFEKLYHEAETDDIHIFYGCYERAKERLDYELNIFRIRLCTLRGE
jgi:hypothetical protein